MGCDQETVRAAEKIILPGDRDRLGCVTQIRVRATCQRDEFSLCTSKFESDHPSHAVQSRRRHFRAWKNARSVARVPRALRVTNFVAVAVIVTGAVCVSARVRSRRHRWAPNLLQRTAAAPLAITDAQASRQGRRSDNHDDCRAEKQFLHDALPWPRQSVASSGPIREVPAMTITLE